MHMHLDQKGKSNFGSIESRESIDKDEDDSDLERQDKVSEWQQKMCRRLNKWLMENEPNFIAKRRLLQMSPG